MRKVLTEKDFPFPTEADMTRENEQAIRRIARQTGAPRIAVLLQEERRAEQEKKEMEAQKFASKLARGVDGRNSPQSAAAQKASHKVTKASAKPSKEVQARSAAKDETAKITIVQKDFTFGREGTARAAAWATCAKSKTVGEYIAAGGPRKYLPRWEKAGAIRLG